MNEFRQISNEFNVFSTKSVQSDKASERAKLESSL